MCPLYPFHMIFLYFCLLLPLLLAVVEASDWAIALHPARIDKLQERNHTPVTLTCTGCDEPLAKEPDWGQLELALIADDPGTAFIERGPVVAEYDEDRDPAAEVILDLAPYAGQANWSVSFNLTGNFLGFTKVRAHVRRRDDPRPLAKTPEPAPVSVVRKKTIQSKVFAYSVALLVSVAYINMGAAMDLSIVKESLRRPVGPAIGFVCQFVLMPLIAFALGYIFDASDPTMRLGIFVTGTSPGGGASNIWTLMFGGNLNLSITMTAISTLAAFFMMPLWIFTLGRLIFHESDIVIPYHKISTYAFCLVVPLSLGLLIRRYRPSVADFLVRILKPLALFLILFILIFGVWANLYIFRLMSWRVVLAGTSLPWLGFAFGCTLARLYGRSREDVVAIAIETGVQNTGVAIFILWFTLDHPMGDMAAVVPVAAATMTPLPLLFVLCIVKARGYFCPAGPEKACTVAGGTGKGGSSSGSEKKRSIYKLQVPTDEEAAEVMKTSVAEENGLMPFNESSQKLVSSPTAESGFCPKAGGV